MTNEQKVWYSVEIETDAETEEAVEFALNELESLGNEINHLGKKPTDKLIIIGYFNEKPDDEILHNKLNESLKIHGFSDRSIKNFEWSEIANKDWLAEWKKHWRPTITEKFIIAPPWETIEDTDKIVIKIEPSMAFGTGTHETTRLCLKAIEENYSSEMSFLDVGTGTGILAIAAAKLATEGTQIIEKKNFNENLSMNSVGSVVKILGCDTDSDSIKIATENAELNDAGEIEFYIGSITEETAAFDFVCANLTADVIVPILPLLVQKFEKNLVLSGILKEQEDFITSELKKLNIEDCKTEQDGEWISIQIKAVLSN
jgi:ribosomal protein L11 methyltransferase